MESEVSLKGTL